MCVGRQCCFDIFMLMMAIHKNDTGKRNTMLGERIGKYMKTYSLKQEQMRKAS